MKYNGFSTHFDVKMPETSQTLLLSWLLLQGTADIVNFNLVIFSNEEASSFSPGTKL